MSQLDLRARSVSELVDAAFQLYRRDAAHFVLLTAVAYAPWLVARALLAGLSRGETPAISTMLLSGTLFIVGTLGFLVMGAAIIHYAADLYLDRSADLARSVREVIPRLGSVVGAGIVKGIVIWLGMILLIVPGIILMVRYFATTQAIVLEGCGPMESLNRSSALSAGRKWHIFKALFLVWLIYFVGAIAVGMIVGFARTPSLELALDAAYTIVAYPILGITAMLLYYDARIRAEGYDIEVMAGGLPSARSAVPAAL